MEGYIWVTSLESIWKAYTLIADDFNAGLPVFCQHLTGIRGLDQ